MAAVVDEIVEPVAKDDEQNEEEEVEDVGETNDNAAVKKKKKKKKKKKGNWSYSPHTRDWFDWGVVWLFCLLIWFCGPKSQGPSCLVLQGPGPSLIEGYIRQFWLSTPRNTSLIFQTFKMK